MYSPEIVARSQHKLEKGLGVKLHRYPLEDSQEIAAHLQRLVEKGKLKRPLTPQERSFVQNERLLCPIDFRYALRYLTVQLDGAVGVGIGAPQLWESQLLTLDLIGKLEEENHELFDSGDPCTGICLCNHKARQLGCTALARLLNGHRVNFWPHNRSLAASLDEAKVHDQLYKRDKIIYDNLPWFLKSGTKFDVKNVQLELNTGSYIMYQKDTQESGMGQGSQFDMAHLTEVASWFYPKKIELDFIPTIPQSRYALCILESTAQGRGDWWHEFTDKVRKHRIYRWHYCFWPWYVNKSKYRAKVPDDWRPQKFTALHADMVRKTSHEFVGHAVDLTRSQLFWYEMNYMNAKEKGELNLFLMNYCATPEESFQFSGTGGFETELVNELRTFAESQEHKSYEFVPEGVE